MKRKRQRICYGVFFILISSCSNESKQKNIELNNTTKDDVEKIISESRSCVSDTQCSIEYVGCPFGCGIALNTTKKDAVIKAAASYHEIHTECWFTCAPPRGARCVANECIEVFSSDFLNSQ